MISKKFVVIFLGFMVMQVNAQHTLLDKKLFSINKNPTTANEFIRMYNKNIDVIEDDDSKKIKNYLNLYINFRLKLLDAKKLKLDTARSFKVDYNNYKNQLIKKYSTDSVAINKLVKQAYKRSRIEVNVEHILLRTAINATPKDTLKAYNKLLMIRANILKGEPFSTLALKYSEDPSVKKNNGDLGYFTIFNMVYPFENVAYSTKIGDVSLPFKTKFGYHILKVLNKRPAKGKIVVEHIMLKNSDKEDVANNKLKIDKIYKRLENGANFEELAVKESQDQSSAKQGGLLPKFGIGNMIGSFENIAFSLKHEGDFSRPFLTPYGWHIVKLIKKYPIQNFSKIKNQLTKKVLNSDRMNWVTNNLAEKLRQKYKVVINHNSLETFFKPNGFEQTKNDNNILFTIENKSYYQEDFRKYLKVRDFTKNISTITFNMFLNKQLLLYHKNHIELENKKIATLLKEYKEGVLIFNLMQKKVWQKAVQDTVGLNSYYKNNKKKYSEKLQNMRGEVMRDYQNYLDSLLIDNLRMRNNVKINNTLLKKITKIYEK